MPAEVNHLGVLLILLLLRVCSDRDLILGDDARLYIAYVMLIWAAPIPATR